MNIQMKTKRQAGFTIIELVVVILLLGILAATAFPRFMDVSDEAHDAVVEGVVGGMRSGSAMFRATWVAEGQSTENVVGYGSELLYANAAGYPIGENPTIAATACQEIYEGLLQQSGGLPLAVAGSAFADDADDADIEADIESASGGEFVAINRYPASGSGAEDTNVCEYYYIGQYTEGDTTNSVFIPYITFNLETGAVTGSYGSAAGFPLDTP